MISRERLEARLRRRVSRDPILRAVQEEGRRAGVPIRLVGGFVRDVALGRRAQDVDLAAGRGAAALVRRLEARWGRRLFRFRKRGVTTWRTSVAGRDVDVVDAGTRGFLEDLRRRELRANAVAFDLEAGRIVDPLGGLRDLRNGILRTPRRGVVRGDPVRALRAARFLAQLPGFRLDRATREEIRATARPLRRASAERVRDELDSLLASVDPAAGLEALLDLGILDAALPELRPMRDSVAGEGRPDVWRHTVLAVAASVRPGRRPGGTRVRDRDSLRVLRWALLLHDVAKPETLRTDGPRPTFHGHEVVGARRAAAILERLRLPLAFRRRVRRLVLFHLRPHHLADAGAPERGMRRLVRECEGDLPLLVVHAGCDAVGSGAPDARMRWRRLRPVLQRLLALHDEVSASPLPRLVDGRDVMRILGVESGPAVGEALDEIRELQEQGDLADRNAALRHLEKRGQAPFSRSRKKGV